MNHIFWRGSALSCDAIKHFIGKGGCHLERLESLSGPFIDVYDSVKKGTDVHIHGPCEGFAMVPTFWHACMRGFILFCLHLSRRCAKGRGGNELVRPCFRTTFLGFSLLGVVLPF